MLVSLEKYGYNTDGVYELIRRDIRAHPLFRFDWFIKSRTSAELSRRCQTLINLLMKDAGNATMDDDAGAKRKAGAATTTNGAAAKRVRNKK